MIPNIHIDIAELNQIGNELGATPQQIKQSVRRATTRTNTTVGKKARMALVRKLDLRRAAGIRRRIKKLKFVRPGTSGVWVGTNPLPISEIKGRPTQTATGVEFRGETFTRAFIGRFGGTGKRRVLRRRGRSRYPIYEVGKSIHNESVDILERKLLNEIPDIFLSHFEKDLARRVQWLSK